jgi:hypothetical protein
MPRQTFADPLGSPLRCHLSNHQSVVTNHLPIVHSHVGATGVSPLIQPRMQLQKPIECRVTAIKTIETMAGVKRPDRKRGHRNQFTSSFRRSLSRSNTLASCSRRLIRG